MSHRLIQLALKAMSRRAKFKPAPELAEYLRDNNIGIWDRERVQLGPKALTALEGALERDFQVPRGTSAGDWEGLSRTEALSLATNEKSSSRAVRAQRVALKALAGQQIRMGDGDVRLPAEMSLDATASQAHFFRGHSAVILVENWEAFERIHRLSFPVAPGLMTALVVYRGDQGAYPVAAARAFLAALARPVHVFPDPDPAGLKIAADFPGYAGLVLPPLAALQAIFDGGRGDKMRFLDQLPGTENALEAVQDPQVRAYWRLLKDVGRALPQEEFVR